MVADHSRGLQIVCGDALVVLMVDEIELETHETCT